MEQGEAPCEGGGAQPEGEAERGRPRRACVLTGIERAAAAASAEAEAAASEGGEGERAHMGEAAEAGAMVVAGEVDGLGELATLAQLVCCLVVQ